MGRRVSLLELSAIHTALGLLGRKIFRIKCCNSLMQQVDVNSVRRSDTTTPFNFSKLVLRCSVCTREIQLDLFLGRFPVYMASNYLSHDSGD